MSAAGSTGRAFASALLPHLVAAARVALTYVHGGGVGFVVLAGLSTAIWTGGGWFVLLLGPVYLLTQRAALQAPRAEPHQRGGRRSGVTTARLAHRDQPTVDERPSRFGTAISEHEFTNSGEAIIGGRIVVRRRAGRRPERTDSRLRFPDL